MAFTNSGLVEYTRLSPNNSGTRYHAIDRISPHCVVGQCSIESLGGWFALSSTQASSNYGIDKDGRIGLFVPESNRSWCTSSSANDNRAVTIECASDTFQPYAMHDSVYQSLIKLCTDICKRNGKKKLLWISNANTALAYEPKADEMLITVHRWFAGKSCPGDWLFNRLGDLANKVTAALAGSVMPEPTPEPVDGEVYRVRKSWNDAKSQIGAFESLKNAKAACRTGYHVYDSKGVEVYPDTKPEIVYKSHIQGIGWQDWKQDGAWSGTQGEGRRLEALVINPPDGVVLDVDVHLQKVGWRTYAGIKHGNDRILGTVGESRRMEAIRIRCAENNTGKKLWYQVHCQTYGTLPACAEGETAGTTGKAKRLEAIRICLE